MGEAAKFAVRNIRRDAIELIKKAEKAGEISEDEMKKFDDKVQKATDKSIEKIDGLVDAKTKEIMKV